jgi:hypothetical protein
MSPRQEEYLPRVTCIFGGEQGELIRKITKISIWFLGVYVVGIECHYGDTSKILGKHFPLSHITPQEAPYQPEGSYGESWHVEHALDGSGGEVITGFCVPSYANLRHFKVGTRVGS